MYFRSAHFYMLVGFIVMYFIAIIAVNMSGDLFFIFIAIISLLGIGLTVLFTGLKFLPKPLNNFTFCIASICLTLALLNVIGQDDKSLLITFFGTDILFVKLLYLDEIDLLDEHLTILGVITRVLVGAFYGFILDSIQSLSRRLGND